MAGKSITPKHSMGKEGGDLHEKLIKIDLRPTTTDKSQLASQTPRPSSVTSKYRVDCLEFAWKNPKKTLGSSSSKITLFYYTLNTYHFYKFYNFNPSFVLPTSLNSAQIWNRLIMHLISNRYHSQII